MISTIMMYFLAAVMLNNYTIKDILNFSINDRIAGYSIITNPKDNNNNFIIHYKTKSNRKYYHYNIKGELINEGILNDKYIETIDNRMYCYGNELYSVDANNPNNKTYYPIKDTDFKDIFIIKEKDDNKLIAYNAQNIYLYDINTAKVTSININICNEKNTEFNRVKYSNGNVMFCYKKNGIGVYTLKKGGISWKYNTGDLPIKVIGIKLSSIPNMVSDFEIDNNNTLVVNCGLGSIYKIDILSGKMVQKIENFRGTGSNAGLMNNIELVDMNRDGINDIVGGSVDHNIYCINGKDFSLLWRYDTNNEIQLPLSLYDINMDSVPEIFSVNDYDNNLIILDGKTGKLLAEKSVKDNNYDKLNQTTTILADYNGNGLLDLIIRVNPQKLKIYEMSDVKVNPNSVVYLPRF